MRKLQLFMHVSLDGFVATSKGEISWIKHDEEIFGYGGEFIEQADTAIYGSVTFHMMDSYWPTAADHPNPTEHEVQHSAWYKKVEKIVLSEKPIKTVFSNTKILSENIPEEINKLKESPGKNIIMLGSPTAAKYLMQHDLIDELWLFINPIVLGSGIPLFKDIKNVMKLKLLTAKAFSLGVVAMHYKIEK